MKRFFLFCFLGYAVLLWAQTPRQDQLAYTLYNQGNDAYIRKDFELAKNYYLQVINGYNQSRYMPYALFMYTYVETDYPKILDALSYLVQRYPDFPYWTNAVEKLGDMYYIMENHAAAIETYSQIASDEALYKLGMLYLANGFQDESIKTIQRLLIQTTNRELLYRALLILVKALITKQEFAACYPHLQRLVSLRPYAYDNGLRALYYAAMYYTQGKDDESQSYALYLFGLLRQMFPLSAEATIASQYIVQLQSQGKIPREVSWVSVYYTSPSRVTIPDPVRELPLPLAKENAATNTLESQIDKQAQVVRREIQEYVVRIGQYKDLSVANIIVNDIVKSGIQEALGVYYRDDTYVVEIRGFPSEEKARSIAEKIIALGYTDTVVVEIARVVRYNPPVQ
ncbi:tetratricopeptide repeat protein [Thermospira aquatica]|uniref:Tetratricopeptide repeat protein n=1 Tax=Thermospira aquatica TaxID=2828656 RepID=A0AAX3BHK9_9SPIR|nr:hypothetical protein [Thermospira aquatica]URA10906.1 hypothetical protein KDW03_03645 [Thermospira aquatica]